MKARKGTTLIEILVLLPLMMAFMVVMGSIFPQLMRETPKIQRAVQTHRGLTHVLRRLQDDTDSAESFLESFGDLVAGEERLLIRLPDRVICYEVSKDTIVQSEILSPSEKARQTNAWSLRGVRMRFALRRKNGAPYAVEVRTSVQYEGRGRILEKLANTHVLFPHATSLARKKI